MSSFTSKMVIKVLTNAYNTYWITIYLDLNFLFLIQRRIPGQNAHTPWEKIPTSSSIIHLIQKRVVPTIPKIRSCVQSIHVEEVLNPMKQAITVNVICARILDICPKNVMSQMITSQTLLKQFKCQHYHRFQRKKKILKQRINAQKTSMTVIFYYSGR